MTGEQKIGILGGTFDPIHMGHLIVGEEVRTALGLSEVWFLPTGKPWMKAGHHISPGAHRLAMVELAIASNPHFRASDMEVRRPGDTYTVDTLEALREERGKRYLWFLLVGIDSMRRFPQWREPKRVLELCNVVMVARPGWQAKDVLAELETAIPGASQRVTVVEVPLIGISGTEVRRRIREGRSIRYLVPAEVEAYIYRQGLYRNEGAPHG